MTNNKQQTTSRKIYSYLILDIYTYMYRERSEFNNGSFYFPIFDDENIFKEKSEVASFSNAKNDNLRSFENVT